MIETIENEPIFSAAGIGDVMIKGGLGRENFKVDARGLRRAREVVGRRACIPSQMWAVYRVNVSRAIRPAMRAWGHRADRGFDAAGR